MNSFSCCQRKAHANQDVRHQQTGVQRIKKGFGWIVPSTLLVLMPKCPMCLAAYVALGTGLTMSYSSAHILMRVLTVFCFGALALWLVRRVVSFRHSKHTFTA